MFTHLHVHTEYSLLDGLGRIRELISQAKELGMDSLAITDHGSLYGVIDFYLEAKEAGIKPIIGCELYLSPQGRHSRSPADKNPYHLILLAQNETGYQNLIQLTTKAHLEGFYYRPRVDKELLAQHSQGLIALSACAQGEVSRLIQEGRRQEAERAAQWYREVFGEFYLEVQEHAIPELEAVNSELVSMSRRLGMPLVATNDVHYVHREDAYAHDILLCIQTNTTIHDPKRMKLAGDSFYLRGPEEMAALFSHLPQVLENTQVIAERCHLDLEFGRLHLPEFETPAGKTADEYLRELCWAGFPQRYPRPHPEAEARLSHELEVICHTGLAHYFLVVWDFITFAKERRILFGVRGSAAASVVLYCLGITDIDPLAHNLVFERFLNVERQELPDIDLDFQDDRRDEVIAYVAQKYGQDRVAQIITFGTMGVRAALRDVGRALGMAYGDVDRVARLVPLALNMTLERALEESPELRALYYQDEATRHLVDTSRRLEGIARHASTHAAGVVIAKEPLTRQVPLQRPARGEEGIVMTQFAMENIARLGLLKLDFLGLVNLTILARAKEIISQTRGIEIDLRQIPLDDKKTFDLLSSGETTGVFQLEGAGMRRYIRELKPTCFSDIAAMVALYRPGPKEHIPTFIRAKHGLEPIRFPHPALARILEETYGVIVYQDQVLLIVQALAGYSLGEADVVRKAMGKKIPEKMREERQRFIAGARKKGFPEAVAAQVFSLIEPFAGYAFNKAHSVSYAMIAYQTAYLKANFPVEYMSAFLTMHIGQGEKIAAAVSECRRLGISVLPPDINRSGVNFTIEDDEAGGKAIRFGLAAIKNVGGSAVAPILAAREEGGRFGTIEDFCRRADLRGLNKRVLESLVKAGALDSLGSRGSLLGAIDRILSLAQREQRLRESGQTSMFDLWGESVPLPLPALALEEFDVPPPKKMEWEKELLGVYLSEHAFSRALSYLASKVTAFCGQIDREMVGQRVVVAGRVSSVRELATKEKRLFVSALLEDIDGSLEVTCWPEVYGRTRECWAEGNILLVEGRVGVRGERLQLSCQRVTLYEPGGDREPKPLGRLLIRMEATSDPEGDIGRLREVVGILKDYPGEVEVHFMVVAQGEQVKLEMPDIRVSYCPELRQRLVGQVGEGGLELEG